MLWLAWSTVRSRKGGFAGAFVALLVSTTLVAACGILLESGLRAAIPTERYAAAALLVTGDQRITLTETEEGPDGEEIEVEVPYGTLPERARVDRALADRIRGVEGVRAVIPARSFPARVATAEGALLAGPRADRWGDRSQGHAWEAAALAPFTLTEGGPPTASDEVVLDAELAGRAGVGPGDQVTIQATSQPRGYEVTGVAGPPAGDGLASQSAMFFSAAEVERLAGQPDQVDAIGVVAAPGADVDALRDRVRSALPEEADVQVVAGGDRGAVEFLDVAEARELLIALGGSFGGVALMVALFVVASTFALLGQQRTREIALLRAVAATPRQVRRMICREAQVVALVAGVVGVVPAVALAGWLHGRLVDRGLVPEAFTVYVGPLPLLVAVAAVFGTGWLAAWVTARRASRIHPTQALGEAAVEPKGIGAFRLTAGLVTLGLGIALLAASTQLRGEAAAAAGASVVFPLIVAAALLSPVLARVASAVLGRPLQRVSRSSGFLAVANTRANSRRLGSVVTPLVLALGVGGVVLFQQDTITHGAQRQVRDGMLADRVLVADAGLPPEVAGAARALPGVAAATGVAQTGVALEYDELGEPTVTRFSAQGVTLAGLDQTQDLDVRDGSLADLDGGTVAISSLVADTTGAGVGDTLRMRLGDGARVDPVVAAVYGRGLGFGDLTFARGVLDGHLTAPLDDLVLVRVAAGADAAEVEAALAGLPYAGLGVLDRTGFRVAFSEALALQAWLNLLVAGIMLGYIAISVANSLIVGTGARARELALLRLVGSTRRQVLAMMRWEAGIVVVTGVTVGGLIAAVTLTMLSIGLTGEPVPYVPPLGGAALVAGVAALGFAAIMLPTRYVLRSNPTDAISTRE